MNNYFENRKELLNSLDDNSLVILYSGALKHRSADSSYPFVVNMNFFYLTGIKQDNVYYVCKKIKGKIEEHLFIYENDPVKVRWIGAYLYEDEAREISNVENIHFVHEFDAFLVKTLRNVSIKSAYIDLENSGYTGQVNFGIVL